MDASPSQWAKRTKHMSTNPKLDQNLTDDEINLIALQVCVAIDDALNQFQKGEKKVYEGNGGRDAIIQLCIEPPAARAPSDQHHRSMNETTVEPVCFEES